MKAPLLLLLSILGAVLVWLLWPADAVHPVALPPVVVAEPVELVDTPAATEGVSESSVRSVLRRSPEPNWVFERMFDGVDPGEEESVAVGTLRGRIAWRSTGKPIEGAHVALTWTAFDTVIPSAAAPADWTGNHLLPMGAVTGREGRFILERVPTRRDLYFYIVHGRHLVDVRKVPRLPHDPGEVVYLDDILLDARGGVSGTVVSADGHPVHYAQVRAVDDHFFKHNRMDPKVARARMDNMEMYGEQVLWRGKKLGKWARSRDRLLPFRTGSTDESGRFFVRGVRPGVHHLIIHCQGHPPKRVEVTVEADRTTEVGVCTFDPEPASVRIRILDEMSQPVPGIEVLAIPLPATKKGFVGREQYAFAALPSVTDKAGYVHCPLLTSAKKGSCRMRRSSNSPWETPSRCRDKEWPNRIEWCFGRVSLGNTEEFILPQLQDRWLQVSVSGLPLEKVRIRLVPSASSHKIVYTRPGVWHLKGLIPNVATEVFVSALGCSCASAPLVAGLDLPLSITLTPTFDMQVLVLDEGGQPVGDVHLETTIHGRRFYLGRTGDAGILHVRDVWDETLEIYASHPRGAGRSRPFLPHPGQREVITLQRVAVVRGRITEDGLSAPIQRWKVVAVNIPPDRLTKAYATRSTLAEHDGSFALLNLREGQWKLGLAHADVPRSIVGRRSRLSVLTTIMLQSGEQRRADLIVGQVMRAGGREIVGHIQLNGQPGGDVFVRGKVWTRGKPAVKSVEKIAPSVSNGYGAFVLRGLPRRGVCDLEFGLFRGGRWMSIHSMSFALSGREEDLRINIPTCYVMLTLFDANGVPLRGRQVRFDEVEGERQLLFVASALGIVEVSALPVGRYRLTILDVSGPVPVLANRLVAAWAGGTIYEDRTCVR